jgi:hypothetical protein
MKTIALSREFDVSPGALRSVLADAELLFATAGVDVRRDGVDLLLSNWIDGTGSELAIRIVRHAEAVFAYKQIDGPFETPSDGRLARRYCRGFDIAESAEPYRWGGR